MASLNEDQSQRRRALLLSLRATRAIFASTGDYARSMKVELGIQMLLDSQVSDHMIERLENSAAIAARDAADLVAAERR